MFSDGYGSQNFADTESVKLKSIMSLTRAFLTENKGTISISVLSLIFFTNYIYL
jgi:hypothetical protein